MGSMAAEKPTLEYESPGAPGTRRIVAALKFIGYALLFVGGAILTGAGIIADADNVHGPGGYVAMAGAAVMLIVIIILFAGGAATR